MQPHSPLTRSIMRAFTLIELLVVIIILAILAAVVIPNVIGRTEDARQGAVRGDISTLDGVMDQFKLDTGNYPAQDEGLQALVANPGNLPKWNGPYIKSGTIQDDPWGRPYIYKIPSDHPPLDYDLFSAGPNGTPGDSDDIGNWNLR